jgi:beta-glucosidase
LEPWLSKEHKQLALEVTQKTIVLLKNINNALPLNKTNIKNIAVIGSLSDTVMLDWYSGTPPYRVTPLQGIKNAVGKNASVKYAFDNTDDRAVKLAKSADVAIVIVGNDPTCSAGWAQCPVASDGKEAIDRKAIDLEQEALVKKVFEANPNTIVVLMSSFPYSINWTQATVPAILHMTHNSQETGNALASVLFGDYNPAGRLVQTWPTSIEHLPEMMDYDITKGRTYMYSKHKALYPFGFGLSYSSFTYSNLKLSSKSLNTSGHITVSVDISNTGTYNGDEVVQLYVSHLNSKVVRPQKELKSFSRVHIKTGETKTVNLILKAEDLAYWNESLHAFEVEKNQIKVMVGSSSEDLRLNDIIAVD